MIEVNLLPKEYLKKSFDFSFGKTGLYAVAAAAAVIVMLIGITFYQKYEISQLDEKIQAGRRRAAMLQKDIQIVEALEDVKGKITNRMSAVEKLDRHRSVWVRVLEETARNVPEYVWLARFKEGDGSGAKTKGKADTLSAPPPGDMMSRPAEVEGYAFSLNALAAFMINMMRSDYFDDVELVSSNEMEFEDHKAYNFVLTCNLHYLSDEESRGNIAQVEGGTDAKTATSHKSLN